MRNVFIVLLFQFTVLTAAGQQATIDSLKNKLHTAKADTAQVFLLAALSNQYLYSHPDSALLIAQQGYNLAQQLGFSKGEALCLNRMANPNISMGNSSKALQQLQNARAISEKIRDTVGINRALNNMGNIYMGQNEFAQALPYMLEAKKLNQFIHIPLLSATVLENLAEIYYNLNQLDSAWSYSQAAYEGAMKINEVSLLGDILRIRGDIQAKKGHPVLALDDYRRGLTYSVQVDDNQHQSQTYLSMANLYKETNKSDSTIYYAKKALEKAQAGSSTGDILSAAQLLSDMYENEGQNTAAFQYYKIATAAKDSFFSQEKVKQMLTLSFDEKMKQQEIDTAKEKYTDKIKIYVLIGGLLVLFSAALVLLRNNRQRQKAYALLEKQKTEIDTQKAKAEQALTNLKSAQAQLVQSEKMASLGELTAGIAHEIQNPLNFINNFSEVNTELVDELLLDINGSQQDNVKAAAIDIKENNIKIAQHGQRAAAIVKNMLQHSRTSKGEKELTDINMLCDEYLRLSYHGLRAKDKTFNAAMHTEFDTRIGKVELAPQEIGRVLLNLFNNAFYSVHEQKKKLNGSYEPLVSVSTKKRDDKIEIRVQDNGIGISKSLMDKVFQPFFTTKPAGQGTGLGLSLSYDIIKAHGGELNIETAEGEGAAFTIVLPVKS